MIKVHGLAHSQISWPLAGYSFFPKSCAMQCSSPGALKRCGLSQSPCGFATSANKPTQEADRSGIRLSSALVASPLVATGVRRRMWRSKATRRLGMAQPMSSLVRALAFSVAFSTAILFSGMNPVIGDSVSQVAIHLEPVAPPHGVEKTEPEKKWSPKKLVAPVLDKVATVKVDTDTEDEYWVFDQFPFQVRILRKETTAVEVVLSGFLAGFLVEFSNALLLHPIDTFKTRLQRGSIGIGVAAPDPSLLYRRLYDGFGPVLLTVPALSIFWAVKEIPAFFRNPAFFFLNKWNLLHWLLAWKNLKLHNMKNTLSMVTYSACTHFWLLT